MCSKEITKAVTKARDKAATASGYTGSDFDKTLQKTEEEVKNVIEKVTSNVGESGKAISGSFESGSFNPSFYMDDFGGFGGGYFSNYQDFVDDVGDAANDFTEGVKKKGSLISTGVENIKKEGTKATEQIKKETGKLGKGDFSLKNAVQGTASGASETFKKSDTGKVIKKIADQSGYTGSSVDTGLQKIEKETSNVVNQTLDAIDSPVKVVNKAIDKAKNFGSETVDKVKDAFGAYETAGKNIETTGGDILSAFQDTFQTGMNAVSALGQNLAKQLGTASGDKGGLKGKTNISDLLAQKRKGRRGGLSRSGTSRTLITGKV